MEALLSVDVSAVSCGPEHVVVVGGQGDVYTWGRGYKGRLGNDCRDAFLVMSSAYYDWTWLKSAVDFEQKNYFCLSRSSYSFSCARKFT